MLSPLISFEEFDAVDIRLGRIIAVDDFPEARKPAFRLTIDLGPEIGTKRSSAQLVGAHTKEGLVGMLVCCVVNFPPKQVGPFVSEVLTLGFKNAAGEGWVVISPASNDVMLGDRLR